MQRVSFFHARPIVDNAEHSIPSDPDGMGLRVPMFWGTRKVFGLASLPAEGTIVFSLPALSYRNQPIRRNVFDLG
jgi:hypothetical protein